MFSELLNVVHSSSFAPNANGICGDILINGIGTIEANGWYRRSVGDIGTRLTSRCDMGIAVYYKEGIWKDLLVHFVIYSVHGWWVFGIKKYYDTAATSILYRTTNRTNSSVPPKDGWSLMYEGVGPVPTPIVIPREEDSFAAFVFGSSSFLDHDVA